jgi:hypothetical protein
VVVFRLACLGISAAVLAVGSPALAEQVVWQQSSWNAARDFIYTDQLVVGDDGQTTMRRVPGGEVGDVGMIQFHASAGVGSGLQLRYHPSRSNGNVPLRWETGCVYITPDAAGSSHIAGEQELDIIEQVLRTWEDAVAGCSYMTFVVDAPKPLEARYDGYNTVKFREQTWCRPASGDDPMQCYSPQAAAITTVFYVNAPGTEKDGLIRDADVELNGVNFAVAVCSAPGVCQTSGAPSNRSDLANTLTHEIGHLLGMDHTCWDQQGPAPLDDDGNTIPLCTTPNLGPEITEATMYNFQDSGETKKVSPEADDVEGICDTYPLAAGEAPACRRSLDDDDGGLCAVTAPAGRHTSNAATAGLLAASLLAVAALRRRRNSSIS